MTDQAILDLLFARDQTGLEAASTKYTPYCMTVARNILAHDSDAEECVNDTLLAAWNSIPPNRPANLAAYLARITRNLALNRLRDCHTDKRGHGEAAAVFDELAELLPGGDDPAALTERRAVLEAIEGWLARQSATKRRIFVCRYWYFDPISTIAARCDMRENAVSVSLNRMRRDLCRYLNERGLYP